MKKEIKLQSQKVSLLETKQKGYAILFTMVLVGIISTIAIGLANLSYKQLILSSVARDSQISFYQADMALECALYVENIENKETLTSPYICGINSNGNNYSLDFAINTNGSGSYELNPSSSDISSSSPCFNISRTENLEGVISVDAKGYNICNKTNIRTVEREVQVTSN